jgi:hypothetical protein
MTTTTTKIKAENTRVFSDENEMTLETPQKTAAFLEAVLKHHDFGFYVRAAQTKFKKNLIENATREVEKTIDHFTMGFITINEKDNQIADIWLHANCLLTMFILTESKQGSSYNYRSQKKATKHDASKKFEKANQYMS